MSEAQKKIYSTYENSRTTVYLERLLDLDLDREIDLLRLLWGGVTDREVYLNNEIVAEQKGLLKASLTAH